MFSHLIYYILIVAFRFCFNHPIYESSRHNLFFSQIELTFLCIAFTSFCVIIVIYITYAVSYILQREVFRLTKTE
jgi:hypothetical protein